MEGGGCFGLDSLLKGGMYFGANGEAGFCGAPGLEAGIDGDAGISANLSIQQVGYDNSGNQRTPNIADL
ncbi:MAG: hypothetical protein IPN13_19585, partial [Bacteroidetes bacterium]|nr:hypothetical protein [Bacteroidota bacterium]